MINSLRELRGAGTQEDKYSLYIVGGFDDDRKSSIELTLNLFSNFFVKFILNFIKLIKKSHSKFLDIFIESEEVFNLRLCLVTRMNDVIKNNTHFPIVYGLGMLSNR